MGEGGVIEDDGERERVRSVSEYEKVESEAEIFRDLGLKLD